MGVFQSHLLNIGHSSYSQSPEFLTLSQKLAQIPEVNKRDDQSMSLTAKNSWVLIMAVTAWCKLLNFSGSVSP